MTRRYKVWYNISMTHAGGRPTIYDKIATPIAVQEYLDECGYVEEVKERPDFIYKDGVQIERVEKYLNKEYIVPTIEGLANWLGISKETLYTWEKEVDKKEFSDVMAILRQTQADMLINGSLNNKVNSLISKVILTKHGYREGIEQTGNEGTPLGQNIVDSIAKIYGGESTK